MDEIFAKATERWSDSEVQEFLSIYAEDGIGQNPELYKTISLRLAEREIYHTPKQCREKIKKLKQDYKKAKELIQQSGGTRRTSKWFHCLDLILRKKTTQSDVADTLDNTPCDTSYTPDNISVNNGDSDIANSEEPTRLQDIEIKTTDKWTNSEVRALLNIYAEDEVQRDFGLWQRNEKVYQQISDRLAEQGMHHSSKHCRYKIKKMKQDYRRIKDLESIGKLPNRPPWFRHLDTILSNRGNSASRLNSCQTLLLEVMSDDEDMGSDCNPRQQSSFEDTLQPHGSGLIDSPGTSGCQEAVSLSPGPVSPSLDHLSSAHLLEHTKGKRKREPELLGVMQELERRDSVFLSTLQAVEEAHMEVLRQELDQRERYIQMLAAHEAREAEAWEREHAWRREEAAEARKQQEAFHQGFLGLLQNLVQVLDKRDSPKDPPLD